VANNFG